MSFFHRKDLFMDTLDDEYGSTVAGVVANVTHTEQDQDDSDAESTLDDQPSTTTTFRASWNEPINLADLPTADQWYGTMTSNDDEQAVSDNDSGNDEPGIESGNDAPSPASSTPVDCSTEAVGDGDQQPVAANPPTTGSSVPSSDPNDSTYVYRIPEDDGNYWLGLRYPAPAALVAASRDRPQGKKWLLWEQESCIRHMFDVARAGVIRGEERFAEAQRRMIAQDGFDRPGTSVVKNQWCRVLRLRSNLDERRVPTDVKATSQQPKKSSGGSSSSPPRSKKSKSKKSSIATKGNKNKRSGKAANDTDEDIDDDDDDDDSFSFSDNETTKVIRKRKDRDDDDDDDEYQPRKSLRLVGAC